MISIYLRVLQSRQLLYALLKTVQHLLLSRLGQCLHMAVDVFLVFEQEGSQEVVVELEGEVGEGMQQEERYGHAEDHVEEPVEEQPQQGRDELG